MKQRQTSIIPDVEALERIISPLKRIVEPKRLLIVRGMLLRWFKTDLKDHLQLELMERSKAQKLRLKQISRSSEKLLSLISSLDQFSRMLIALHMKEARTARSLPLSTQDFYRMRLELKDVKHSIELLASAAEESSANSRGRPRNNASNFIIQDLAAIYEWSAHQSVKPLTKRMRAQKIKAFTELVQAAWPVIFNRQLTEQTSVIKTWRDWRKRLPKRIRRTSLFMVNFLNRHPHLRLKKNTQKIF